MRQCRITSPWRSRSTPQKNEDNIRERGIPLAFGQAVIEGAIGEAEDTRRDYGEVRMKAFAHLDGRWFTCVYTIRGPVTHIITVYRVSDKEVRKWLKIRSE
jgi:uncharacterized DUF497 family protein